MLPKLPAAPARTVDSPAPGTAALRTPSVADPADHGDPHGDPGAGRAGHGGAPARNPWDFHLDPSGNLHVGSGILAESEWNIAI